MTGFQEHEEKYTCLKMQDWLAAIGEPHTKKRKKTCIQQF